MNNYVVIYLDDARTEYYDALIYYKERSINAAVGFETALATVEGLLSDFPEIGRVLEEFPTIRKIQIVNYPYTIYYRLDHDALEIVAISLFNTYRDPQRLTKILRSRLKQNEKDDLK
jgi:plasmid stabilization system protein ParE